MSMERSRTEKQQLLALLSEAEMARVVEADVEYSLQPGEEYLDLDHLDRGVQRTDGRVGTFGQIVPKRAIASATWTRVIAALPKR